MSGSGCWRVSGRANPRPLGKEHRRRGWGHGHPCAGIVGWPFLQLAENMGPCAPAIFIFKRRTEQIAKMPCFGTALCLCDDRIFFFFFSF